MQGPVVLELFQHDGVDYEVCLEAEAGRYNVWCRFAGGERCDGYNFSVDIITDLDAQRVKGISLVQDLQATAKDAVVNEHWKKYKAAIKALSQQPSN